MSSVAVVTRTKDRPTLLLRAAESVCGQTLGGATWIVVNDAGARDPVERIASEARGRGMAVEVIHRETSTGMEAASNAGIRHSESDYVVIHDDDDSWHPTFLERTVGVLEANPQFGGVVCRTEVVEEELSSEGEPTTLQIRPHFPIRSVSLADLAVRNTFPPIAFLYRRRVAERVGLYNEELPVLGDWDFNLRFLAEADIIVVPETLARYHQRNHGQHRNTVTQGQALHHTTEAQIRNRALRRDFESGRVGMGFLLAVGANGLEPNLGRTLKWKVSEQVGRGIGNARSSLAGLLRRRK